jgi:ketosteroid isomerase-like protein
MLFTKQYFILTVFTLMMLLCCTQQQHNKNEVEMAMKQYDHLIQKMDMDSIALFYTPDGDLGSMAHGRDSIRKFLAGFKNMKVLSQISTSDSTTINADTALQKGFYNQTVIVSANDTVRVKGAYTATWLWVRQNGWLIKKMETKPVQ